MLTLGSTALFYQNTNRWWPIVMKYLKKIHENGILLKTHATLNQVLDILRTFNPKIAISFTESIRHTAKDGMEENAVNLTILKAPIDHMQKKITAIIFRHMN